MTDQIYNIIIKSNDNSTKFFLTKEQLNNIEYFKFIDDLKINETTFVIELEYTKYLACVMDIISFINIKSDNYLLIKHNVDYSVKNENSEMINYYLDNNKIGLNDLLKYKNNFLKEITIKNPVLSCIWYLYNNPIHANEKYPISKNTEFIVNANYIEPEEEDSFIDIHIYHKDKLLVQHRYDGRNIYKPKLTFLDTNNVIIISTMSYLFMIKFNIENNNISKAIKLNIDRNNNYGIFDNKYYFASTRKSLEVYDLINDKKYKLNR